jgi:hypothetical protein
MPNAELITNSEWVAHASRVLRSASLLDLFSANGGAYQPSLGQRPREVEPSRAQALKARFIQRWYLGQAESRFQRWVSLYSRSWGVAPGCHETAPLALSWDYQPIAPKASRMLRHHTCHATSPCGRDDRTTCPRSPSFGLGHSVSPSSLDIRHSSFCRDMYATDDSRIRSRSQCLP